MNNKYKLPEFKKFSGRYKITSKKISLAEKIRFLFLKKVKETFLLKNEEREILILLEKENMPYFWIHKRYIKLSSGRCFTRTYNSIIKEINFKIDYDVPMEEVLNISTAEVEEWKESKYKIKKMMS